MDRYLVRDAEPRTIRRGKLVQCVVEGAGGFASAGLQVRDIPESTDFRVQHLDLDAIEVHIRQPFTWIPVTRPFEDGIGPDMPLLSLRFMVIPA